MILTVLDVQPRMVGSGGGKTSDEIVYELAENILGKLRDSLDMDSANKALFEVTIKHFVALVGLVSNPSRCMESATRDMQSQR